jgi:hypothetical protein
MEATLTDSRPAAPTATPASPRRSDRPASLRTGTPRTGARRRVRQGLLVVHVLSSVGWFGLAITVAFCGLVGRSRGDLAFYEVIRSTLGLSVPLGLTAAASGVALSLTTRWGLLRHWWIVAKQAITIAVIVTDVAVVGPEMAEAIDTGRATAMPGPVFAHCVVLAIATALSIVKPRARTPLGRRQGAAA